MGDRSRAVLITGCSTGIGAATALRLHRGGWKVYATARRLDDVESLRREGCKTLQLDVTDERSMRSAVDEIVSAEGAVSALVNNAGYSQGGPIEEVPLEACRRQFETNVFGPIKLTQLVLPSMRAQGWGRIVNIGSMGGRLTFPGGGLYHATKHSLEAISDALRFEVKGFGVDVVLIEPGLITTEFGRTAAATVREVGAASGGAGASVSDGAATPVSDGAEAPAKDGAGTSVSNSAATPAGDGARAPAPYSAFNERLAKMTTDAYEGPLRRLGGGPDVVAKAVERAISAKRPPTRMLLTPSAKIMVLQRKLLPDRAWDALMRLQLPQPR